ncbi:pyroglutamyl-peptidase I [Ruania suaedae]|uniref:pyroglutamyl-peptidase I family protein n=1 Tax=Ruania suaedae TaxID=2897774 RepID=UPI001E4B0412|nr:pyroglutamyl-peptidase I [Ruania suaedae]UFU04418.1 pyroglutamyl-peptidase I [Ruania suaedae]
MTDAPATVLLTGFEPFDGAASNPSMEAVRLVAGAWERPEALVVAELPVSYRRAGQDLDKLLHVHRPQVALATGLAAGRSELSLERLAVNLRDARIPDNDGEQPVDTPVQDGPAARWATLPLKRALAALTGAGIPAALSMTAGTYVCNAVAYRLAAWAQQRLPAAGTAPQAGFVHVPGADVLAPATVAAGLRIVLETALAGGPDLATPAGSTS